MIYVIRILRVQLTLTAAIVTIKYEKPLIIRGAECVAKSYPNFFEVYRELGGMVGDIK